MHSLQVMNQSFFHHFSLDDVFGRARLLRGRKCCILVLIAHRFFDGRKEKWLSSTHRRVRSLNDSTGLFRQSRIYCGEPPVCQYVPRISSVTRRIVYHQRSKIEGSVIDCINGKNPNRESAGKAFGKPAGCHVRRFLQFRADFAFFCRAQIT